MMVKLGLCSWCMFMCSSDIVCTNLGHPTHNPSVTCVGRKDNVTRKFKSRPCDIIFICTSPIFNRPDLPPFSVCNINRAAWARGYRKAASSQQSTRTGYMYVYLVLEWDFVSQATTVHTKANLIMLHALTYKYTLLVMGNIPSIP